MTHTASRWSEPSNVGRISHGTGRGKGSARVSAHHGHHTTATVACHHQLSPLSSPSPPPLSSQPPAITPVTGPSVEPQREVRAERGTSPEQRPPGGGSGGAKGPQVPPGELSPPHSPQGLRPPLRSGALSGQLRQPGPDPRGPAVASEQEQFSGGESFPKVIAFNSKQLIRGPSFSDPARWLFRGRGNRGRRQGSPSLTLAHLSHSPPRAPRARGHRPSSSFHLVCRSPLASP